MRCPWFSWYPNIFSAARRAATASASVRNWPSSISRLLWVILARHLPLRLSTPRIPDVLFVGTPAFFRLATNEMFRKFSMRLSMRLPLTWSMNSGSTP